MTRVSLASAVCLTLMTAMLMLLVAGCGPGVSADNNAPSPVDVPPMPDDFRVSIGGGGGVAGSWSSTEIGADGTVTHSSMNKGPADVRDKLIGRMPVDARLIVWREVHAVGFFSMTDKPDNMNETVTVFANGKLTSVSNWPSQGPPGFQQLVATIRAQLKRMQPPADGPEESENAPDNR